MTENKNSKKTIETKASGSIHYSDMVYIEPSDISVTVENKDGSESELIFPDNTGAESIVDFTAEQSDMTLSTEEKDKIIEQVEETLTYVSKFGIGARIEIKPIGINFGFNLGFQKKPKGKKIIRYKNS